MSIYKDCDIRGIYPKEITPEAVYLIGRALAAMSPGEILVGGDVRTSTPCLKEALTRGLIDSGAQVVDLGTIPTPALYFALKELGTNAGATVTASHNPPEYNGVKFMIGEMPVTRAVIDELHDIVREEKFPARKGSIRELPIMDAYINKLSKRFAGTGKLRVLVDAGNGAMSKAAPQVLRNAGYEVVEMNCIPDGTFPNRDPNPSDYRNLKDTCESVRKAGVDFAVAFDGDGDRAVFIDGEGQPVQNEKTLVLFIRELLKSNPTPVVFDQKASSVVRDAVLEMSGMPMPEKSGHAFIKKRFLENGAALGGEVSGHFFFGELGYDDGLFAALTMGQIISESGRTLKEMTQEIVCPPITPDIRIPTPYARQEERLRDLEDISVRSGAVSISHLDGVRADFKNGWILVRKSVTAEQITVRAEARTQEELQNILDMAAQILPDQDRKYLK